MCEQHKAGGMDISLDVSEIEGLSEDELCRRYDTQSHRIRACLGKDLAMIIDLDDIEHP